MKNTNCLAGMMCPKCGHTEKFVIAARTLVDVTDDGAEPSGGAMGWFDDSYCSCGACKAAGVVSDFRLPTISVTFNIYTPLSLEMGEADRHGWWMPGEWLYDEYPGSDAFEFDPEDYDPEEHASIEDAIVEWAVKVLRDNGAIHPSEDPPNHAQWWNTEDEVHSCAEGSTIGKQFHLNMPDEVRERVNIALSEEVA